MELDTTTRRDHVNYTDEQWDALYERLEKAAKIPHWYEKHLDHTFRIAKVLVEPEARASYNVGWNAMTQDYIAYIHSPDAHFMGSAISPDWAMLLVLELWLDKREALNGTETDNP